MLDGKIVLLGSDHDAVTFLHYVEHVADIPGKRIARYQVPVTENGCRVWRAMEEFDTSGDGAHANWPDRFFAKIVDSLLAKTRNNGARVGKAMTYILSARELLAFALPVMKAVRGRSSRGRVLEGKGRAFIASGWSGPAGEVRLVRYHHRVKNLHACAAALILSVTINLAHAQQAVPATTAKPAEQVAAPLVGTKDYQAVWWKEAVVYQIYPRSFQDSNGDGIGDLNGITEHLDYLQKLGINVIWLSPHYDSPNADNGYDIRDYRKVMQEFGTMADFGRMLAAIKARHMRLIIDLVVNHTSDEHHWFAESHASKDNSYRDYYIWRDGRPNPADPSVPLPPNNYPSYFSGPAWQFDPVTQQFYLHLFAAKQPDLNWDNPRVREDVFSLMRFWLDKGVDGFRMDVIPLISKPPGLPDLTAEQLKDPSRIWANGPHRDEYLQQMNREVLSKYDVMTVGEAIGITLSEETKIINSSRKELSMVFNFDAVRLNRGEGYTERAWTLPALKAIYDNHARVLDKTDWDTVFLSNHDNPRLVSNFGDDSSQQFRIRSAKLLETMLLTLRGTPFLYQGDELGMTNYPFRQLDQFNDIEVKNAYQAKVLTGKMPEAQFIAEAHRFGRDNSRTPMQWSAAPNAGFTTPAAKPWLAVNPNYTSINAAEEVANPDSVFHYTQRAIALHRAHLAFVYGDYQDLDPTNSQVFAYTRALSVPGKPAQRFLVVLNFGEKPTEYTLPERIKAGKLLLANVPGTAETSTSTLHLGAWDARIYTY